ncbi:glycosyltransferase [Paracoccus zhouxuedongae]|uniref:glycosyltransferase n=1 Tax=Paracoccus sp. p4-l81 TaxID=3342806 RepID=UPI0035BC4994
MTRIPTICLNMIVRDEASIIGDTLASICDATQLNSWVIHDTGSKDKTPDIICSFFEERGIPGRLSHRQWINFGHNRQAALEDALGMSDFVLIFDADCHLEGKIPDLDIAVDSYMINSVRNSTVYPVKQIIRNHGGFRWRGVVHEGLYFIGKRSENSTSLPGVRVINRSEGYRSRDPATYYRDAQLLMQAIQSLSREDQDLLPRYVFYTANSWRDAKCPREAVEWYQRRIDLGGWKDEIFISYLNLGICLRLMGNDSGAIEAWTAGSEICPDRAECLYKLAQAERERGRYNMALLYAKAAMQIRMPAEGRLFLMRDVYDFWSSFEYLWALKNLGRQNEGDEARAIMKRNGAPQHLFHIVS